RAAGAKVHESTQPEKSNPKEWSAMEPRQAAPTAINRFANLAHSMCQVQLGAPSQRSNDSSVYPHNTNGKPWLLWRRPCDKRNEFPTLGCPKVKQPSAIILTRSARWNRVSPSRREQLYRGNSKIQIALCGWATYLRVGVSACRLKLRKLPPSLKLRWTSRRGVSHRAESALLSYFAKRFGGTSARPGNKPGVCYPGGVPELSPQGAGFAEPWVRRFCAICPVRSNRFNARFCIGL